MLVSVIITTYRRPQLFQRAVRSVLRQTLDPADRLELVVSDDDAGFTALEGLSALQDEFPAAVEVKLIRRGGNDNGVAASRNRALQAARGEWLLFLDDDDALVDGGLGILAAAARRGHADFVAGGFLAVAEDAAHRELSVVAKPCAWAGYDELLLRNAFPVGSFLIRRETIRIPFNTHLQTLEDWLFLLDNLRHARVEVVPQAIARIHQTVDASREHRNLKGGFAQLGADHLRIYSLHPRAELAVQRRAILAFYGPVSVDALIGAAEPHRAPGLHGIDTGAGHFIVCNPLEPIQAALRTEHRHEAIPWQVAGVIAPLIDGAVIDVGAHIGAFAVPLALRLPGRQVIGVEPQRGVFLQLCANVLANRLANLDVRRCAVGEASGENAFIDVPLLDVFTEPATAAVSLDPAEQQRRASAAAAVEPVPLVTLDQLAGDLRVALVKVGVEGMELQVLRSGERLLREQKPSLLFAVSPEAGVAQRRIELLQSVFALGYTIFPLGAYYLAHHPARASAEAVAAALAAVGISVHSSPTVS